MQKTENVEYLEPEEVDGPSEAALDLFSDGALKLRIGASPVPRIGSRGRPRGVPNKNSRAYKLAAYIAARGFKDPGEFLASVISMHVDELARMCSCERAEALKMQIGAANNLLPYMHKRMPQELQLPPQDGRPVLIVGSLGPENTGDPEQDGPLQRLIARFSEPEDVPEDEKPEEPPAVEPKP